MDTLALLSLFPYAVSACITLAMAYFAWRRRERPGAVSFAAIGLLMSLWTVLCATEVIAEDLTTKVILDALQWLPTAVLPYLLLVTALQVTRGQRRQAVPVQIVVFHWSVVFAFAAFLATDRLHGLAYPNPVLTDGASFRSLTYDFSAPVVLVSTYLLAVTAWGLVVLLNHLFRGRGVHRWQGVMVLIGFSIPIVGAVLSLFDAFDLHQRDISPMTFAVGGAFIALGLFRFGLLDIVPLARRVVVDNIPDIVLVVDSQRRIIDANPVAREELLGLVGEPLGRGVDDVFAMWPDVVEKFRHVDKVRSEITIPVEDRERTFDIVVSSVRRGGTREGWVVVIRDITDLRRAQREVEQHRDELQRMVQDATNELIETNERLREQIAQGERLQEQLVQSQKMEAVGRLAGGVAHDFNNVLTAIICTADALLFEAPPNTEEAENLHNIRAAADRAASLTRQLLAFSRKQVLRATVLDINEVIAGMGGMLAPMIGEDVKLQTTLRPGIGCVKADRTQLEQVIMNLAVNARDAMQKGGTVTIETAEVQYSAGVTGAESVLSDGSSCIAISISDTGEGIPEEVRQHIFEPFFTTKGAGKGTGLGLSTVFGIVQQSGGRIDVESTPGTGTTFTILLPCTSEQADTRAPEKHAAGENKGNETILLVEDDPLIREVTVMVLRQTGYTVLEAQDAEQASALSSGADGDIHLLLTDVVLPGGTTGPELAQGLRDSRPDMRVLFVSGYTDDSISEYGVSGKDFAFLPKPFDIDELTAKVRQVLGKPRTAP